MKKAAILTFSNVNNYGAILQAYALQTYIKTKIECEIIDYYCPKLESNYKIISVNKGIKENIKSLVNISNIITKRKKIKKFKKKHMNFTDKYCNKNIKKINENYDTFIVGSDQVWNIDLTGKDLNFFLDFVSKNNKKNSYAASIGFGINNPQTYEICKKYLKTYNNILVREQEAKEYLKELNIKSTVVLDPTLLLSEYQYRKLFLNKKFKNKLLQFKNYVFVYKIATTPHMINTAKEYAKKNNLQLIIVHSNFRNYSDCVNFKDLGIEEFLYLLSNANKIFTSSFHGLCLSIIFKKDFFFEVDYKKNNCSSRITTLTNLLDLNDRQIDKKGKIQDKRIDYEKVYKKLEKEKNSSIKMLEKILEGEN